MMEVQCRNYNLQYDRQYICVIPPNIYGPNDNYSLVNSHVIPGLLHRMYLAKMENKDFYMYGTGKPLRQFLYSYDFARVIKTVLFEYTNIQPIICCNDEEITIGEFLLNSHIAYSKPGLVKVEIK